MKPKEFRDQAKRVEQYEALKDLIESIEESLDGLKELKSVKVPECTITVRWDGLRQTARLPFVDVSPHELGLLLEKKLRSKLNQAIKKRDQL